MGIEEVELQRNADSHRSHSQTEFDQHKPLPQILNKKVSQKTQKCARIAFVILFSLVLLCNSFYPYLKNADRIVLSTDECIRDYSFVWTDHINMWLRENLVSKDRYMVVAGFFMDFMILSAVGLWAYRHRTGRIIPTLLIFYELRGQIQNLFFMSRPEGFLWFKPSFPSLAIAYHDTNDFYYSGHVGCCTIFTIELWALGERRLSIVTLFILINEWMILCLLRTHYVIDLVSGLTCALLLHRVAEKVAFLYDVKFCGFH